MLVILLDEQQFSLQIATTKVCCAMTKAGQNHQLQDLPSQEDETQKTQQRCPNPSTSLPIPSHALNQHAPHTRLDQ